MRSFVTALIILAMLVGVFIADDIGLRYITDQVAETTDALSAAIQSGEDTQPALSQLKNRWEHYENWMLVLGNHKDVDNISISILKVDGYLQHSEYEKAVRELAVARYLLTDLPEKDKVSWVNIF